MFAVLLTIIVLLAGWSTGVLFAVFQRSWKGLVHADTE
jgi:hypothetical protein